MWFMDILNSAGLGTIVGGVFGWLTKREERENMKMKFDYDIAKIKATTDASIAVAKMGVEEAQVSGALAVEKVEARAFVQSQKTTTKFSEILKSLIRPIILALLMYQTYLIINALETITGGLEGFTPQEVYTLYRIAILSVIGLTATAVGWYFAARSSKQFDILLKRWDV